MYVLVSGSTQSSDQIPGKQIRQDTRTLTATATVVVLVVVSLGYLSIEGIEGIEREGEGESP